MQHESGAGLYCELRSASSIECFRSFPRLQGLSDALDALGFLRVQHREDAVSEFEDAEKGMRSLESLRGVRVTRSAFPLREFSLC